jgi:ankyrin repeat protein
MKKSILRPKPFFSFLICIFIAGNLNAQTLQEAFAKKDTPLIYQLIADGANVNELDKYGATLLMTACRWGELSTVKFLIDLGARVDSPRSSKGRTPLIVACAYYGGREVCAYLIAHGAKVNAQSNDGTTALMLAAQYWKSDIVELLLKAGADAGLKDTRGQTAIDYLNMNAVNDDLKKMLSGFVINKDATAALLVNAVK